MSIAPEFLMPLPEVLQGLAGVFPYRAASQLRALFLTLERTGSVPSNGLTLTADQLRHMLVRDVSGRQVLVTPAGARTLIELYRREILPLRMGAMDLRVEPHVQAYADSESQLLAKTAAIARQAERIQALVENPAGISEYDLSYELLHQIFDRHAAPNASVLSLGDLRIARYVSNVSASGKKAAQPAVTFRWTGADGAPRELSR